VSGNSVFTPALRRCAAPNANACRTKRCGSEPPAGPTHWPPCLIGTIDKGGGLLGGASFVAVLKSTDQWYRRELPHFTG
jgi:hypothetical protein